MRCVVCNNDHIKTIFNALPWTEGEIALFRAYSMSCSVKNLSELTFLWMRAVHQDGGTTTNFTASGDIASLIRKSDSILEHLVFLMETSEDVRIKDIHYADFYGRITWYISEIMNTFEAVIGYYDKDIEFHLGEGGIVCTQV